LILDLRGLTVIADYFVICSGESTTQARAIAEHIKEILKKERVLATRFEGMDYARWILMDYGDVIIHVFEEETRHYYELERLWLDAPRVAFADNNKDTLDREDKREISPRRDRAIS